ncbi:MAG: CDP-alcohol phosphatidyltransferase family protein [Holosporales bacterium]|nr:CDP-alcohol phosphatidyltransferase family protein [Holosporales bacterium]
MSDNETRQPRKPVTRHIPNIISITRALLAVPFVMTVKLDRSPLPFSIILLGAISDFLDGYIARRYRLESKCGALLDPIADKVFMNSVLWSMCLYSPYSNDILLIVAITLTTRDFLLALGGLYFIITKNRTVKMQPIYASKVCTTMVFTLCLVSIIFTYPTLPVQILGFCCSIFIVGVFIAYVRRVFINS